MRVYIPLGREGLERLAASRSLDPPVQAYAVMPAFEAAYGSNDIDELEYAAMLVAAEASTDARGSQLVVAADVVEVQVVDGDHPAAVEITAAVPLERVASIHVGSTDEELEWYAVQELPQLIRPPLTALTRPSPGAAQPGSPEERRRNTGAVSGDARREAP